MVQLSLEENDKFKGFVNIGYRVTLILMHWVRSGSWLERRCRKAGVSRVKIMGLQKMTARKERGGTHGSKVRKSNQHWAIQWEKANATVCN